MPTQKYLKNYADQTLCYFLDNIHDHEFVLVIPAYNESDEFISNLISITSASHEPVFIIIIINYPENSCKKSSELLLKKLIKLGPHRDVAAHIKLVSLNTSTLALCGPFALPKKEGVGRARKIGADWALSLISAQKIRTPIIFSTDADALLPAHYFKAGQENLSPGVAALVYPFKHKKPADMLENQAITLYEQKLIFYVDGLKIAGSPYAFHTIGSTLAIRAESYAQVRGFPCRAAGEDFYVLNKLCKVGRIKSLICDPILLSARVSDRVPFGTGPALRTILENNNIINRAPIFYHPQVFVILREFITYAEQQIKNGSSDFLGAPHVEIFKKLSKYEKLEENLKSRTDISDRLKAFHCWFDGFMTLKFIHHARDQDLPMCSMIELEKLGYIYKV